MFNQIWRFVFGPPSKMSANGYMTAPGGRPFSRPGSPYRMPFAYEMPPARLHPDTNEQTHAPFITRQYADYGGPDGWTPAGAWTPPVTPPGQYANLRAPRSNEAASGPRYNPADLLALDGEY